MDLLRGLLLLLGLTSGLPVLLQGSQAVPTGDLRTALDHLTFRQFNKHANKPGRSGPRRARVGASLRMQHLYLAVCSRVGPQDGLYLDEWMAFHLVAGVQHFFLWVDPSVDPLTRAVATRWFQRGVATEIQWREFPEERTVETTNATRFMAQCYDQVAPRTRWMALIDTDEFIVPSGCSITRVLRRSCHPNIPWIPLWWVMFGSGNLSNRSSGAGLVIEDFTLSGGDCDTHMKCPSRNYCSECRHSKVIVNTWCARTARHAHNHWVERHQEMPPECLEAVGLSHSDRHRLPLIQLNLHREEPVRSCSGNLTLHHYAVLSRAEFTYRREGRQRDFAPPPDALLALRDLNFEARYGAQKFGSAVRSVLNLPTTSRVQFQCFPSPALLEVSRTERWKAPELEEQLPRGMPPT